MRRRFALLAGCIALLALLALGSGCTSADALTREYERGQGAAKVYPLTTEAAYDVALHVLRWEGASEVQQHRDELRLIARFPDAGAVPGADAGVWIEPEGLAAARVAVVSTQKDGANAIAGMSEATFHASFARGAELIAAGRRLPATKPQ